MRRREEGNACRRQHLYEQGVRARNPLLDDSIIRRYFPELAERAPTRPVQNLGSGVIVSPTVMC
jgi:hypothetical protein